MLTPWHWPVTRSPKTETCLPQPDTGEQTGVNAPFTPLPSAAPFWVYLGGGPGTRDPEGASIGIRPQRDEAGRGSAVGSHHGGVGATHEEDQKALKPKPAWPGTEQPAVSLQHDITTFPIFSSTASTQNRVIKLSSMYKRQTRLFSDKRRRSLAEGVHGYKLWSPLAAW